MFRLLPHLVLTSYDTPARRAENTCRFCDGPLPDWADLLLPGRLPPAAATVNVYGPDGRLHRLPLRPGQAGRKRFLAAVRGALGLPEQVQLTLNFEVPVPCQGEGWWRPRLTCGLCSCEGE